MKCGVFLSKETDDWATPNFIYEQALSLNLFDPCPLMPDFDGLAIDWQKRNFVNPPYSKLKSWIQKSIEQHRKGSEILLLIPARTDTKAFKFLVEYGAKIFFISGRLKFGEKGNAPFPSMLVKLCGGGYQNTICQLIEREKVNLCEVLYGV